MAEADPHCRLIADDEFSIDAGHILRSRFLDSFTIVEVWASERVAEMSGSVPSKAQLSQKLNAIEKEALSDTSRFCHPQHVIPLIEKIRQISKIRSDLVHSKCLLATISDGRKFWLFQNTGDRTDVLRPFQLILDQKAFEGIVDEVQGLSKKLEKQKLRSIAPD